MWWMNYQKKKFRLLRPGGLGLLSAIVKITKIFSSGNSDLYSAWQGMQYMRNMMDEWPKLKTTDNHNYLVRGHAIRTPKQLTFNTIIWKRTEK